MTGDIESASGIARTPSGEPVGSSGADAAFTEAPQLPVEGMKKILRDGDFLIIQAAANGLTKAELGTHEVELAEQQTDLYDWPLPTDSRFIAVTITGQRNLERLWKITSLGVSARMKAIRERKTKWEVDDAALDAVRLGIKTQLSIEKVLAASR